MRKPLRRMLLPALAAVAIAAGGATAPASAAEKFIFAHPMNVDHVFHAISERYMAALADNAAVELEYHPGGDLGDWTSLFEQAMQGVVPMTLTWASSGRTSWTSSGTSWASSSASRVASPPAVRALRPPDGRLIGPPSDGTTVRATPPSPGGGGVVHLRSGALLARAAPAPYGHSGGRARGEDAPSRRGRSRLRTASLRLHHRLTLGHLPMVLIVTFIPDLSLALPRLVLGIE